jgi:hypothetical protein
MVRARQEIGCGKFAAGTIAQIADAQEQRFEMMYLKMRISEERRLDGRCFSPAVKSSEQRGFTPEAALFVAVNYA